MSESGSKSNERVAHFIVDIHKYISEKAIVTCSEVADEIKDEEIKRWLIALGCEFWKLMKRFS